VKVGTVSGRKRMKASEGVEIGRVKESMLCL
jgi:hypothetical protein